LKDFDEAEKLGPGSTARHKLFENSWCRTGKWRDSQHTPSIENGWAKGHNVLVHQRNCWPDKRYEFAALNSRIDISAVPDVRPSTDGDRSKTIWAVDITKTGDSVPEWERNKVKFDAWGTAISSYFFLLCMWAKPAEEAMARVEQTQEKL
jgi:hypothetical protein